MSTGATSLSDAIAAAVGDEYVFDAEAVRSLWMIDGVTPEVVVAPGTPEEIAAVLSIAREQNKVVVPAGGLTRQTIGRIPQRAEIALSTARLNGVFDYDPGDLTIGLGAGVSLDAARKLASAERQMLAIDAAQPQRSTIGGALATAVHGPLKHGFGGVREFCTGVEFVTGDGKIAKAGGRVVKNVAGYDVMKLLIRSHGTLAVITRANFKLFPAPRQTRTFIADFVSMADALAFRSRIIRSPLSPMCCDFVSPGAHEYITENTGSSDSWSVAVRASGSDAVLGRYARELGSAITRTEQGESEGAFWAGVSDFAPVLLSRHPNAMALDVHCSPSLLANTLATAERAASEHNFLFVAVGRCAVASMTFGFVPVFAPATMQYAGVVNAVRASLPRDSACIVTNAPVDAKRAMSVWGIAGSDCDAMLAIKRTLDPADVLNRGRFLL